MKTINTYYKNYRDLQQFVETNSGILFANNNGAILVRVFSSICEKNFLNELSKQIIELVPHAQVLGAPTSGEIMNGMISEQKTILSFPVFQHSVGRSIATALNVNKAKVLIIFVTGLTVNSGQMLKGVQSVNAADNFAHQTGFVICNEAITDCGVVGVALAGECLTAIRDKEGRVIRSAGALFDTHDKKLKEKKVKECFTQLQQEITERKQAEEALRTSRETLSLAVELARLGPWNLNFELNMFEFGDEFYAIYGTDVAREGPFMAPDVYAREFVHPDDAWMVEAEIHKGFSSTERYCSSRFEHRIIRRDGVVRTIVVQTNFIKDADGKLVKIYGANQDITEQKEVEEALRISRETLSLAAELARLGPWKYDANANMFEFGNEFYAIFGTNVAQEGAFMTPDVYTRDFMHPDDAWMVEAETRKVLSSTGRYCSTRIEHRIIRRDGLVRTIVVRANIEKDADGQIVMWYGANQDITELKQTEEALRISRETLSLAAELARLGPWKVDIEKNLFEFGNEFYAIYGTDVAREGYFMTPDVYIREFVHPEDARMVEEGICKGFLSTERFYSGSLEHRIIRRDGVVRTIIARMHCIRDVGGKVEKVYGANLDITEHKQAEEAIRKKTEEIQRLAYTDSLTNLPNRAYITERLEKEMEKARLGKSSGVLLFIDLDNLKMVNDAFGHTYGDALIIMAGNHILEQVGSDAFVGRIGGDEFMAILPGKSDRQSLRPIIEGIIAALCQDIEVLGVCFHISASAGAAIYPNDGDTSEEIFKNADNAMYAAKKAGKNCWRFYEATMQAEAYKNMLLTNNLHYAIERGELLLHYQPQVSVNSGLVVGFEALLRWNSLEHGSISPLQFIPIAEQSGLIQSIGEWVLREACRFVRRLADQGWGHIHVAVNVSPHQLRSDLFIERVRNVLNDFGVLPCQLQLEITETALISSLEESTRRLNQLRAMGVRLALDDFGTGYSSLTYLQHLPVTTLKIDKSFIEMIPVVGTRKSIVGNVVDMAHTMEMNVVAEGVETQEQFDYLAQYGCDCIQGYLFSRPIPEEEAVKFLPIRFKC